MEDSLIVAYDDSHPDVPTLTVARKYRQDFTVLNKIQGNVARGVYYYLTGCGELKELTGKWKLHKDGSGTCDQCGGTAKNVWDYDSWQNYCGHCGVKMTEVIT